MRVFSPQFRSATESSEVGMQNREMSQILYEQNPEYRNLSDQHRSLEDRLSELSSRLYLSETERIEEVTLKKKKLALKDKMQDLLRRHNA
jgi:uncharacterized protein YdcH (DUF465 family)